MIIQFYIGIYKKIFFLNPKPWFNKYANFIKVIPKVILSKDIPSVSKMIPIANLAVKGIPLPILSTRSFQGKHILLFAWIPTKKF